jgi:predicted  nucleic acid-binding Zn-ribbon protein
VDPPARFRRSLFGYSPSSVRAYLAEQAPPPDTDESQADAPQAVEELGADREALEEELRTARDETDRTTASLRATEAAAAEAQDHAREAEQRVAGLEADLRRAQERSETQAEELRVAEEEVEQLTVKLDALRTALTAEIQKVWDAEMRVHEVGTELGAATETLRFAEDELAGERARADEADARARAAIQDAQRRNDPWTAAELGPVFDMAQRTVTRIIAEAHRRGEVELSEVQERVETLRTETSRLEEWRSRVEPFVMPVRRSVEEARVEAERVGGLIREALEPMNSAVTALGERLIDLAAVASPSEGPQTPPPQPPHAGSTDPSAASPQEPADPTGHRVIDVTDQPADSPSW